MKNLILSLMFFFITRLTLAIEVKIQLNPIHSFVVFTNSLMDLHGFSPQLKTYFFASENYKKNKIVLDENISKIIKVRDRLNTQIIFTDRFGMFGDNAVISRVLASMATKCNTLDDFINLTNQFLSINEFAEYKSALKALYPIYLETIYNPNLSGLKKGRELIEDKLINGSFNESLDVAKMFYNSSWPSNVAFEITLYPIPEGINHSNATVDGSVASVGYRINEKDLNGVIGVIFHEMAHALYSNMPKENKENILKVFQIDSGDIYIPETYKYLNEILATLNGNGWYYKKLAGKLDESTWYNVPEINLTSKNLYPLFESYMLQKKSLDESFLLETIKAFKQEFPNYEKTFKWKLTIIDLKYFLQDDLSGPEIRKTLRNYFNINGIYSDSITKESKKIEFNEKEARTKVLIIFKNDENKFKKSTMNRLIDKKTLKTITSPGYYYQSKSNVLFLFVGEKEKFTQFLENLSKEKTIQNNKFINII